MSTSHMTDPSDPEADPAADGWREPLPGRAPAPTYAPAALALGLALLLWGAVTSWLVALTGLVLVVGTLGHWIGAIRADWRRERTSGDA